jgi:hypothetical protein
VPSSVPKSATIWMARKSSVLVISSVFIRDDSRS